MPQPIGLVITKDTKLNFCPVNWQVVSTKYETPLTVCIGLSNQHYTLKAILDTKEFVYAYPSRKHLKDTIYCGTVSGHDVVKQDETNFELFDSNMIKTPCLQDAVLNFECTLLEKVKLDNYTIIVGKVLFTHESQLDSLEKIYALGGQRYGTIEKVKTVIDGRDNLEK